MQHLHPPCLQSGLAMPGLFLSSAATLPPPSHSQRLRWIHLRHSPCACCVQTRCSCPPGSSEFGFRRLTDAFQGGAANLRSTQALEPLLRVSNVRIRHRLTMDGAANNDLEGEEIDIDYDEDGENVDDLLVAYNAAQGTLGWTAGPSLGPPQHGTAAAALLEEKPPAEEAALLSAMIEGAGARGDGAESSDWETSSDEGGDQGALQQAARDGDANQDR